MKVKESEINNILIAGYGSDIPYLLEELNLLGITGESHNIYGNCFVMKPPKCIMKGKIKMANITFVEPVDVFVTQRNKFLTDDLR